MINLKDIQARNLINPEPKEVTEARKFIRDSFKNLMFVEGTHQYFVGSKELPSVSAVCHSFQPEVDWDSIAARKAEKEGKTKEELLEEWHQKNITSTSCGSKTHYFGEQLMNLFIGEQVNLPFQYTPDNYIIPYAPKEKAVEAYWTDILNNPDVYPVMPETKIYIDNGKIKPYAGTFDILLAYRYHGGIVFAVQDFKTNADLKNDFNRFKKNHLLDPFTDLIDEPLSIYSIQLSLYQLALESIGISVIDRTLVWLKEDGSYEKIRTKDLTDRLLACLPYS